MSTRRTPKLLALLLVAVLTGAGCAQGAADEPPPDGATSASSATAAQAAASAPAATASDEGPAEVAQAEGPAAVATAKLDGYGTALVDGTGRTLYVFFEDRDGQSTCEAACADNWPPLVTAGGPTADGKVDEALLGVTERTDGTSQVTYDGQPLYHYSGDSASGDVLGFGLGNVWYPVAPDGEPIDVAEDRDSDDGY